MKPIEALDEQVRLVRFWRSDYGRQFGGGTRRGKRPLTPEPLHAVEAAKLNLGATFWVSPDMQAVVEHAAQTMPPQPLLPSDLPSNAGFAVLARSIRLLDRHGRPVSYRAFSWGTSRQRDGVHLVTYTDTTESPGEVGDKYLARWKRMGGGRLTFLGEVSWRFGDDFVAQWEEIRGLLRAEGMEEDVSERLLAEAALSYRFMLAFWTICQQRIAARTAHHLDRAALRRAARTLTVPPEVVCVDLRRTAERPAGEGGDEGAPVNWTHRWLVDGHWRNQWLPSVRTHRLQWIDGYVKGPVDAPLVVKDRVYRVVR